MASATDREIEVRFLEVDVPKLLAKLHELGATDLGQEVFHEVIFYDAEGRWLKERKRVRVRTTKAGVFLTYKHFEELTPTGTKEIELKVGNIESAKNFLVSIGLVATREQEKKRHTFTLNGVTVDIDTWPKISAWVELEGDTEASLRAAADALGFDWAKVELRNPLAVLEEHYRLPVSQYKYFTFARTE